MDVHHRSRPRRRFRRGRFSVPALSVLLFVSPALALIERLSGKQIAPLPVIGLLAALAVVVIGLVAVGVRESDRLRGEVRAQNERLAEVAAIVESTDDSVTATTLDGTITSWNRASELLYGYSAAEMIGRRIHTVCEPDRHQLIDETYAAIARGESVDPHEATGVRRDGSIMPVALTVSILRDANGAIRGASTIARDISDRRAAETEREALLSELAEQNGRLREVDRMKDDFIASVSHELRTPLTSIRGYLELLQEDGGLDDEQARMVGVVDRNADRLLGLVSDLLFVAQVDAGQLTIGRERVHVVSVAAEAVEAAGPRALAADVALALDACDDVVVDGDRTRLAQVLDNLISNAIKFTPAGGRVDVRIGRVEGSVTIAVADTGVGISEEERVHLFERFFRTAEATRAAVPGTGLGLAIVAAITESHGGTIDVQSREGGGTTFVVTLPLSVREPAYVE